MDYEKKYKDALEKAKEVYNRKDATDGGKLILESMFHELKESEDERIRKAIINLVKATQNDELCLGYGYSKAIMLAWLEKQGEKSNMHQDAEDDLRRQHTIRVLEYARSLDAYNQYGKESINKDIAWLEKQGEKESDPRYENLEEILAADDIYQMSMNDEMVQEAKEKAVNALSGMCIGRFLGLENQGKQKSIKNIMNVWKDMRLEVYQQASGNRNEPNYSDDTTKMFSLNDIDEIIEKMSEQKPADRVETKQKPDIEKGKWYVCNNSRYKDFVIGKAYYCPKDGMLKPNENEMARYVARDCFHLWTIQDAKDGDVLANNGNIILFKEISNSARKDYKYIQSHCLILAHSSDFYTGGSYNLDDRFHPATKEQRDTLMKAIADAGYEWDLK